MQPDSDVDIALLRPPAEAKKERTRTILSSLPTVSSERMRKTLRPDFITVTY